MTKILVVDDEEGIRSFIAEALESEGHAIVQAANGDDALRQLDAHAFHVMITDLRMPGIDGMSLVRKARAERPEMEVIVLTAHGSVESAVAAMKLGAFDYLRKPISGPAELRLLVARALERHALLTLKDRSSRDQRDVPALTYGDPAMTPVVDAIRKVAKTSSTVLLLGESGTGKEIAARAIHAWSDRADWPFVAVNCAALAETLLESELFGHEKGAFTGATARRRGRVELADGGTLFLDEVAELKPELQAKLLRVLQDGRFERVGGAQTIEADVRWIAATNKDLHALMTAERFRDDLYHRLAVFPIRLPPLRERRSDILPLAEMLLGKIAGEMGSAAAPLTEAAKKTLHESEWPGNVRELANALERALILTEGNPIESQHLGLSVRPSRRGEEIVPLEALEREAIQRALARVSGNRRLAAEQLGLGLRTLYDKLKRYGLE